MEIELRRKSSQVWVAFPYPNLSMQEVEEPAEHGLLTQRYAELEWRVIRVALSFHEDVSAKSRSV